MKMMIFNNNAASAAVEPVPATVDST